MYKRILITSKPIKIEQNKIKKLLRRLQIVKREIEASYDEERVRK